MSEPGFNGEPRRPFYEGPPQTGAHPPPHQYPPGWGDPYAQYAAHPGHPPYPYTAGPHGVGYPLGYARPGNALAAAVLGYVAGGLLIIAGLLLFFGASFIANFDNYNAVSHSQYIAELAVNGVGNLVAAGLLIGGGIGLTGRGLTGRVVFSCGAGIVVIETIYWLTRWGSRGGGAVVFYAIVFGGLAVVGAALAWSQSVNTWLRGRGTS